MHTLHPHPKITPLHLQRKAIVYLRQSSERQVQRHTESQRLQYALADRARTLGFEQVGYISACNKGRKRKPGEGHWCGCYRPGMSATGVDRSLKTPINVCNKLSSRCFGAFVTSAVSARPLPGSKAAVWNCR